MATNINAQEVKILTPAQAAEYVGLSVSMLAKMRCLGGGPAYLKLGRAVRYRQDDLDVWLNARRARSTSDAGRLPGRLTPIPIDAKLNQSHANRNGTTAGSPDRDQSTRRSKYD